MNLSSEDVEKLAWFTRTCAANDDDPQGQKRRALKTAWLYAHNGKIFKAAKITQIGGLLDFLQISEPLKGELQGVLEWYSAQAQGTQLGKIIEHLIEKSITAEKHPILIF